MLPAVNEEEFSDMNAMLTQAEQDGNQISWAGENKDGYQYLVMLTEAGAGSAEDESDENSYILYLKTKNENGNVKKLLETVYHPGQKRQAYQRKALAQRRVRPGQRMIQPNRKQFCRKCSSRNSFRSADESLRKDDFTEKVNKNVL